METSVIEIKQLPVIVERLHQIKTEIEATTANALALECNDDTVKEVRRIRADLNKRLSEFEARRKDVKSKILAPYDEFEKVYKECISEPFRAADQTLSIRIKDVEESAKKAKMVAVTAYYNEYRDSLGLKPDDAPIANARLNVTLSASLKSLKATAKEHLDNVAAAIAMIREQEHSDEIMLEYRRSGNASQAVLLVNQRHREIEEERQRNVEERDDLLAQLKSTYDVEAKVDEAIAEYSQEALTPPTEVESKAPEEIPVKTQNASETPLSVAEEVTDDETYEVTFTVRANLAQIKLLKQFLNDGGYDYE